MRFGADNRRPHGLRLFVRILSDAPGGADGYDFHLTFPVSTLLGYIIANPSPGVLTRAFKHPALACRAGLGLSGCKAGGTRLSRPFAPLTLPQNTQNGLRPSQNTQKYWGCRGMEAGGLGVLCLLCAAKRLQCVQ